MFRLGMGTRARSAAARIRFASLSPTVTGEPTRVLLPIAYSPFIRVYAVDQGGTKTRLATYRQPSEPRIQFDVPAGELNVLVRYPKVFSIYADIVAGRVR